jgi:hypothetical protein
MTPDELKILAEDIAKTGVQIPITVMSERVGEAGEWSYQLLDGRNRLDAIELAGFNTIAAKSSRRNAKAGMDCGLNPFLGIPDAEVGAINYIDAPDNPYAYVISANIHRRHLTAEQKRELIAELLKAAPEKSDRQIAKTVKASPTFVGKVRAEKEATGDVSTVDTRTDTKGRRQPATKPVRARVPRHYCWQCGRRGEVGEVQEHRYPAYDDADVWLHDACIAAFERQQREVAAPAPRDNVGADSANEAERLRVCVERLEADKQRLEIKILGLEREIAELRRKLAARAGDMSTGEFQTAIKKWEDTVETQRSIIARLENENASLRAGAAAPPADDGLDIPEYLRRDKREATT